MADSSLPPDPEARLKNEIGTLRRRVYPGPIACWPDEDITDLVARLLREIADFQRAVDVRDHVLREHADAGGLFQPGGRYDTRANIRLGHSAVVEGMRWLDQQLQVAEATIAEKDQQLAEVRAVRVEPSDSSVAASLQKEMAALRIVGRGYSLPDVVDLVARLLTEIAEKDQRQSEDLETACQEIYTEVLNAAQQAWPERPHDYCDSPVELIGDIIEERDGAVVALAQSRAEIAHKDQQLEADTKLLNHVAEALGVGGGDGDWDESELIEAAEGGNVDDVETLKRELTRARAALEALQQKWERDVQAYVVASREANREGRSELDAYRDGKAMGLKDCVYDLTVALSAPPEPTP